MPDWRWCGWCSELSGSLGKLSQDAVDMPAEISMELADSAIVSANAEPLPSPVMVTG